MSEWVCTSMKEVDGVKMDGPHWLATFTRQTDAGEQTLTVWSPSLWGLRRTARKAKRTVS